MRWEEHHKSFVSKHRLASDGLGFVEKYLSDNDAITKSRRVSNLVDIAWAHSKQRTAMTDDALRQALFLDVSQSVTRQPWALGGLRTLTTSSKIFAFSQLRFLEPVELLLCLGFSKEVCRKATKDLSPTQVADLAAEAMGAPTVAMILLGLIAALPVWTTE